MFGLLKNKLASFIKGLSGKEEKKEAEALPVDAPRQEAVEEKIIEQPKQVEKKAVGQPNAVPKTEPKIEKKAAEEKKPEKKAEPRPEKKEEPKPVETKPAHTRKPAEEKRPESKSIDVKPAPAPEIKYVEAEPAAKPGHVPVETTPAAAPQKQTEAPRKEEPKKSIIDVLFNRKPAAPKPVEAQKQQPVLPKPVVSPAQKIEEKFSPAPAEMQKIVPAAKQPELKKPAEQPIPDVPKQAERDFSHLERKASSTSDKKDIAPKIGIGTTLKSIFSNEITIGESEVSDLLSELELSLLEADVAYDVSLDVSSQLRTKLVGMKVPKGKVEERTRQAIQDVLTSVMTSDRKFDMVSRVRSLEKPAKILFVGPNGAGKTTTMAKVAHMLLQDGLTVVFSASDTFRAAAIEQTEVHAGRLGVKVVKSKYGADPASVAFEAVSFARAHNIDVVLIDSAGRQDTNANLLDELKKISRVAKPDIKIYIGESIGGNSLIDQVRAFDEAIGMDGAILTKIDCDAKGGTALSLTKSTGIPVLYLGVGQAYADLIPFEPEKIAQDIMS